MHMCDMQKGFFCTVRQKTDLRRIPNWFLKSLWCDSRYCNPLLFCAVVDFAALKYAWGFLEVFFGFVGFFFFFLWREMGLRGQASDSAGLSGASQSIRHNHSCTKRRMGDCFGRLPSEQNRGPWIMTGLDLQGNLLLPWGLSKNYY